MTLNQILYFQKIANLENYHQAAEELYISQPSLSRSMASLENELGVEAYIRYMDDFVILSPDKEQLRSWLARIEQFLREELKLEFNPKTTILAAKNGIDFVGYKHRATHRKVRKDSIKRIKRTIKKCESGKITTEQLQKSIQSWTGHAGHADSYNLRKKIETLAEAAIEKAA